MTLQERFGAFGAEAKGKIRRALASGNAKLLELDGALERVAKDDWTVPGIRRHVEGLRSRAVNIRSEATKRAQELPGEAVARIVTGSRAPVQTLAKQLAELAKKLDPPAPKAVKTAESKPEAAKEPKVAKAS